MTERKQHLYVWLAALFVAALLTADLIGGRVFRLAGHDLSAGMLAFPFTFLLTDIVNEFYGPAFTRRLTYVGLGAALFAFGVINVALLLPVSPESVLSDEAFRSTFSWSRRLYVASLAAYLIGQLLDIAIFSALRRLTRHRLLWLRATGSTLLGQAIDTGVVTFGLFYGAKTPAFIAAVARDSYVVKVLAALALTPIVYAVHALLGRVLHVQEASEDATRATENSL